MIAGVVLAAGRSERFGSQKLLEPLGGLPLVCHSLRACIDAVGCAVIVVTDDDRELRETIEGYPAGEPQVSLVVNPDAGRGQMSSLTCALRALDASADAAMIFLADMPFITSSITERLVAAFEATQSLVVPVCDDVWRHPRIIPRRYFDDFCELGDDERGTTVFERHAADTTLVPVGPARDFLDIDTRRDLEDATGEDTGRG